jgi:hypothetical protein
MWHDNLAQVVRFYEHNGRLPKRGGDAKERFLAAWVNHQRKGRATMRKNRVRQLERLEWWKWEEPSQLSRLVQFYDNNGRLPTYRKNGDPEEKFLATWVSHQRSLKKCNTIQPEIAAQLTSCQWWKWTAYP